MSVHLAPTRRRHCAMPTHILRRKRYEVYDPQGVLMFDGYGKAHVMRELCVRLGLYHTIRNVESLWRQGYRCLKVDNG